MDKTIKKLKNFVGGSKNGKQLILIYLLALVSCTIMLIMGPKGHNPDTTSYFKAGDMLFSGKGFDSLRTPLYPLFLKITHFDLATVLAQYLMFFISIPFVYATLNMLTKSSRLVLTLMLLYVFHPAFLVYHNQLITESLSLSIGAIFFFYLVKFILQGRKCNVWAFHIVMLCLVFIKPAFIYLLAVSLGLLGYYLFFQKRPIWKEYLIPLILTISLIFGYALIIKSKYGVFGVSKVSDINIYYMLKQNDLLDPNLTSNEEMKKDLEIRLHNKSTYFEEPHELSDIYGWVNLHEIVQRSLKKNYKDFLVGSNITKMRIKSMSASVGLHIGNTNPLLKNIFAFSLFHLMGILILHGLLIIYFSYKNKKLPLISLILTICIWLNFLTVILSSPDDYGRLMVPSLIAILIIIMQYLDWFVHFINKKEAHFILR